MRRATRKIKLDNNHASLCGDLRKQGVEVVEILEPVDTILMLNGFVMFCEIKTEDGRTPYRRSQLKFLSETKFPAVIAKTATEALTALKTRKGLSQGQKDALAGFLVRREAKQFSPEQVEKVLAI